MVLGALVVVAVHMEARLLIVDHPHLSMIIAIPRLPDHRIHLAKILLAVPVVTLLGIRTLLQLVKKATSSMTVHSMILTLIMTLPRAPDDDLPVHVFWFCRLRGCAFLRVGLK